MRLALLHHHGLALAAVTFPPGYRVYTRQYPNSSSVLVDSVPAGTLQYDLTGLANASSRWAHVRAVSSCNVEDNEPLNSRKLLRVAIDDDGDLIAPVPNKPVGLTLIRTSGGGVTARWQYIDHGQRIAPSVFNVYVAGGVNVFDFSTPTHTVSYTGGSRFSQALGTFAHDTKVRVVVRARSAANNAETNVDVATVIADALAPDAVDSINVEVEAE